MKLGVLGGGQLGRMLALAGYPLGLEFRFLEAKDDPSVGRLGEVVQAAYDDAGALRRLARGMDRVTYEFENVPVESARLLLDRGVGVDPAPAALAMARDRVRAVDGRQGLDDALDDLGLPAVLKTRRGGYDGKGQFLLSTPGDVEEAWDALGEEALVLEAFVDFDRELSVLGVRSREGEVRCYPLVENDHVDGILRTSIAPAPRRSEELQARAEGYASRLLDELAYVGVAAVELFQIGEDLLANELAPRVHNSGHWTLDGARCSQFENHLRAVCGFALGSTEAREHTGMFNLLGGIPDPARILEIPGAHLHIYDKSPRPLRKLGHVNVTGSDRAEVRAGLEAVRAVVSD